MGDHRSLLRFAPFLTWVGAGLAFVAYPALRPYADETAMPGLAAMASDRWVVAHLLGMTGFVLLAAGVTSLTGSRRLATVAVLLLLPYYGGEAFALHAVGQYAVRTGDVNLLAIASGFRYQPAAMTMFGIGLLLLAVVAVRLVVATRHAGRGLRIAVWITAAGLALYLPQFYGTPTLRIAHGVLLGLGCVLVGLASRASTAPAAPAALDQAMTPIGAPVKPGNTLAVLAPGKREATTSLRTAR